MIQRFLWLLMHADPRASEEVASDLRFHLFSAPVRAAFDWSASAVAMAWGRHFVFARCCYRQ